MTSLVKDLLARVGTAEAAFVTACQERDAAELALADERKGRALLARATDRINELEAEIAQVRRAMERIVKCSVQSTAGEIAHSVLRIIAPDPATESETQIGPTG